MTYKNIARFLDESALRFAQRPAVTVHKGGSRNNLQFESISFSEALRRCDSYAHGMQNEGIQKGMKVLLAVRPGLDFMPLCFALFKIGAIPVLIDPGMGKSNFLDCISSIRPEALVGTWKAHLVRLFKPKAFASVRLRILTDGFFMPGARHIHSVATQVPGGFEVARTRADDTAAIVFTTGSTGIPKGVVYFHEQMEGQVRLIQKEFKIGEDDVDFPIFPLFALFSAAWGIEAVIPSMDPTQPGKADSALLAEQIRQRQVTFAIGSPTVWDRLGEHCLQQEIKLDSISRILMVGAPVRGTNLQRFLSVQGQKGQTYTPYGATEALPVLNISGEEILSDCASRSLEGHGTCIGRPFPEVQVKIIRIQDSALPYLTDCEELGTDEIGEILVCGPVVTQEYFNHPKATEMAKVRDGDTVWHRMGDVGYRDKANRIWFCGRKNHRVVGRQHTWFSVCSEGPFYTHPDVYRAALVPLKTQGTQMPAMCIELKPSAKNRSSDQLREIDSGLRDIASAHESTRDIQNFYFHPGFPMDIRHNAKIFREKLAVWVEEQTP